MEIITETGFNKAIVVDLEPSTRHGRDVVYTSIRNQLYLNKIGSGNLIPTTVTYESASSEDRLKVIFEEIKEDCVYQGMIPLIHLECHSSEDANGLRLESGELIPWSHFSHMLQPVNRACKNSLVIVMSVCHGYNLLGELLDYISHNNQSPCCAPFYLMIGPRGKLSYEEIEVGFPKFYERLLSTGDLLQSVEVINEICRKEVELTHESCHIVFHHTVMQFLRQTKSNHFSSRVRFDAYLADLALNRAPHASHDFSLLNTMVRAEKTLLGSDLLINMLVNNARNYLMVSEFPELEKRLSLARFTEVWREFILRMMAPYK